MAQLHSKPYEFARKSKPYTSEGFAEEQAELERLRKLTQALPAGELTGALVRFPIADGYAEYVVKSTKPLVLQHIPFFDGYAISLAHLRGLRLADIEQSVSWERRIAAAFAQQNASSPA